MSGDLERRITARMVLDSSGFNSSLQGINAGLRNVDGQLRNANATVGTFGRSSENLGRIQETLSRKYELQAKKVETYSKAMERTKGKMQANIQNRDRLRTALDNANTAHEEAIRLYGRESTQAQRAADAVNQLEAEYQSSEQAVEANARAIERYEGNLNRAEAQMTRTQGELNEINTELERSQNRWIQAGDTLTNVGGKMQTVGKGMSTVGNGILKATAPLVGIGVASLKVSGDFEAAMSNVKALSQATGKDFDDLKAKAKEMGAATSMSATESADGMANLALAGWNTTQIMGGIEPILRLAEAGNIDLARASSLTTDSMSALQLEVQDLPRYLDLVAQTARSSNTDIDQMAEAYLKVGGVMSGLNVPLEESAIAIGILANNGIKGAEGGTALSAVMTNLTAPTGRAKKALDELNFSAFDGQGNFKGLENVLFDLQGKMEGMTEEQKSTYLAMIGGKEHVKDLNALLSGLGEGYDELKANVGGADGALADMATTMQDNVQGELTKLKSQLEGVGIQLGETLLPMASKAIGVISDWTEKFSNLSPEMQETLVKTTALAVGLGGLLSVGGKVVTGVGAIVGLGGKLATALGGATAAAGATATATAGVGTAGTVAASGGLAALTTGLGGVVVAAAPYIAVGAAVAGVGYAIHKGLTEEALPAVDLFADKSETTSDTVITAAEAMDAAYDTTVTTISDSTKEAVGAYIDLDDQATNALNSLYINSTEITEKTKTEIVGKYAEMGKQVTSQLEKDKDEQLKTLQSYFSESSAISEQEEAEILENTTKHYTDKQDVVENAQNQIKAILERASSENRAITKNEQQEINNIQQQQRDNAVRVLSENEVEAKVILERMKEYDGRITAEQASEHIQTLNKQRDDAVQVAHDEYNERIATIVRMRDEAGVISAEQATALINDAKRQRDGIIEEAENTRNGAVAKIANMNSELQNSVDLATGKILSHWDKLKNWWDSWKPGSKKFETSTTHIEDYVTRKTDGSGSPRLQPLPSMNAIPSITKRWTGDSNFQGGLTTLHEKGYEVYDLPQGTRIFNHEASQDQVMKTAEAVARRIVSTTQGSSGTTQTVNIHSPSPLSPSEIARRFKNVSKEIAMGI